MAVTALKIGKYRMKFMTLPEKLIKSNDGETEKLFFTVDLRVCDEDFIPTGKGSFSINEGTEEDYHKTLRKAAQEEGHYIPEESTDPEWNPIIDLDKNGENRTNNTI